MKEVTFSNVQELLNSGKKPEELFIYMGNFKEGFAIVRLNGKSNFINKNRKILSPNQWFDLCFSFHEGVATIQLNGKWNFINKNGKLLSNQWFDDCDNFQEGFAWVKLNEKWYYIDENGNLYDEKKNQLNENGKTKEISN